MGRWKVIQSSHELYDKKTGVYYISKDNAYVEILNILYDELQEVKQMLNEVK
jgi:hypothetical protein